MKATFEFDADEIESFAIKVISKLTMRFLGSENPALSSAIVSIQQAIMAMIPVRSQEGPVPYARRPPPPAGFGNVSPIRETGALECCLPIPESRHSEGGWACCGCATFNGPQRTACRTCGHSCCCPGIAGQSPTPEPVAP